MRSIRYSLKGKVAIVTGGAQRLGEAAARALADRGAEILLTDLDEALGDRTSASIRERGSQALFLRHDAANEGDWISVVDEAILRFGKADILVNGASVTEFMPIHEMSVAQFDRVMAINVRSVFLGCKHILRAMERAGGGSIVNMSSIAGMTANAVGSAAYAASNGAIRLMTKAVALDYADRMIRVNSVHAGGIRALTAEPPYAEALLSRIAIDRTPMKRVGLPHEVGAAVVFLASNESSYTTGAELVVDGGWLAA